MTYHMSWLFRLPDYCPDYFADFRLLNTNDNFIKKKKINFFSIKYFSYKMFWFAY